MLPRRSTDPARRMTATNTRKRSRRTPEPAGAVGNRRCSPAGRALRRAQARRATSALRSAARDGRRAPLVGGAEGTVVRHGRQAARGERRGPPARVRRLRGDHPRRELRRRRGHRLGPRRVGPARGSARGAREGEAPLRARGLQAPRQVDAGEDQEEREGLAAHQGARRLRSVGTASLPRGVGALRAHGRGGEGRPALRPRPSATSSTHSGRPAKARRRRRRSSSCWPRPRDEAFTRDGWLFELKLDGYRLLAAQRAATRCCSRATATTTRRVSRDRARGQGAAVRRLLLDGEVVVLDEHGQPQLLAAAAARHAPARRSTSGAPRWSCRRRSSPSICSRSRTSTSGRCRSSSAKGAAARGCCRPLGASATSITSSATARRSRAGHELGLEGIIAKGPTRHTRPDGRPTWLKINADRTGDFVIVGFTAPRAAASGFGALQLAAVRRRRRWSTPAASAPGSASKQLTRAHAPTLETSCARPTRRARRPRRSPKTKTTTWVEPMLRVRGASSPSGPPTALLRQPVFLRMRDDKRPDDVRRVREERDAARSRTHAGQDDRRTRELPRRDRRPPERPSRCQRSQPQEDLLARGGYTKGDSIEYYRAISPGCCRTSRTVRWC